MGPAPCCCYSPKPTKRAPQTHQPHHPLREEGLTRSVTCSCAGKLLQPLCASTHLSRKCGCCSCTNSSSASLKTLGGHAKGLPPTPKSMCSLATTETVSCRPSSTQQACCAALDNVTQLSTMCALMQLCWSGMHQPRPLLCATHPGYHTTCPPSSHAGPGPRADNTCCCCCCPRHVSVLNKPSIQPTSHPCLSLSHKNRCTRLCGNS
jgi:hypothetical protein